MAISLHPFNDISLLATSNKETFLFCRNSGVNASKFRENLDEMFPLYYMMSVTCLNPLPHCIVFSHYQQNILKTLIFCIVTNSMIVMKMWNENNQSIPVSVVPNDHNILLRINTILVYYKLGCGNGLCHMLPHYHFLSFSFLASISRQ